MSATVYNVGKSLVGSQDIGSSGSVVLNLLLVTTDYTYDHDHATIDDATTDDPVSYEIAPSGYSRQEVTGRSLYTDNTNDFVGLDAADVTFASLAAGATIGGAVAYRYSTSGGTTGDTGQVPVAFYALTPTPTNGGDITVTWASTSDGSMLKIGSTS
jgi:hypothetical protein